ncbi:hypothetical protein ACIBH1_34875 [Nonomuraea sp. NPDC050663]|uniref:hypothetical protein n=1 Tax=Nonomuraea sp. NPDC050663 TaxID=3364370 RepID=UPI003794E03E
MKHPLRKRGAKRELGDNALIVGYSGRALAWTLAPTIGYSVYTAVTSSTVSLHFAGGFGAFIFVQSWRLLRRRVALGVGPVGIYLPKGDEPPQLIPWEQVGSIELAVVKTEAEARVTSITVTTTEPREHVRQAGGWLRLHPSLVEAAVQRHSRIWPERTEGSSWTPAWLVRARAWITRRNGRPQL